MNLTAEQLSMILGIKPNSDFKDISIIIKNNKTKETLNEFNLESLFEGIYNIPVNLDKIQLGG